jgi:4-hydroxythreonine-4-phosphate dehydrogenase
MMDGAPGERFAPIAVTMGEPAGIGGEIALLAWSRRTPDTPPFFLIDDPGRLRKLAAKAGLTARIDTIPDPGAAPAVFNRAVPVLPLGFAVAAAPGKPDAANAGAVVCSIDQAVDLAMSGNAGAMVTNPIHKTTLYDAGFGHPGHTEYLADRAHLTTAPVMMLACTALKVVPVTIHLALKDALQKLSANDIVHCGRVTAAALARDFGIAAPRIAVAGLNPHAGEDGHLGREEIDIIGPAVARLRSEGLTVAGPFPADTLFHAAARKNYDAVLCMYHDQALIPLKTIDFDGGVNTTLGLPFVRTSPDHGTAFDIAGTGKANPASFIAALHMAAHMAAHRRAAAADCRVA